MSDVILILNSDYDEIERREKRIEERIVGKKREKIHTK